MTQAPDETKKCPFCAETIKAEAIVCRYCGRDLATAVPQPVVLQATPVAVPVGPAGAAAAPAAPARQTGLSCTAILVFVAALAVIALLAIFLNTAGGSSGADTSGGEGMAFIMSQSFVKDRLKSPATAKFPNRFDDDVVITNLGGERYRVLAWVDSENSFGAMIRTTYLAELHYAGNDNWKLDSLEFDNE